MRVVATKLGSRMTFRDTSRLAIEKIGDEVILSEQAR